MSETSPLGVLHPRPSHITRQLAFLFRCSPTYFVAVVLLILVGLAGHVAVVGGTGFVVGIIADSGADSTDVLIGLSVLCTGLLVTPIADSLQSMAVAAMTARYHSRLHALIACLLLAPDSTDHLTDPETGARLKNLAEKAKSWERLDCVTWFWKVVGARITGLTGVSILMWWNWWAGLLVAAVKEAQRASGIKAAPDAPQSLEDFELPPDLQKMFNQNK